MRLRILDRIASWQSARAAVLAFAFLSQGCPALAPAAKTVTKSTVGGLYDEIDSIDAGQQDRVVRKLLDSPAVHDSAHDLVVSVVTGGIDGLTASEREGKINAFVDASLNALRQEGDRAMGDFVARVNKDLAPVLRSLIQEIIASTSAALRDAAAHDLPVIVSAVLESALRGFAIASANASEQLRAQAKSFAEQDLGPLAGTISQQVAREAVIGVREGMHRELDLKDPTVREGMREIGVGLAQGVAQGTPTSPFTTTFAIATFVLTALLLIAIGIVIALYTHARANSRVIALLAQRLDGHDAADRDLKPFVPSTSGK